jgi:ABC-type transport system substrate-binding protein
MRNTRSVIFVLMVFMLLVSPLPGYGAGPAPTDTLVVAMSTLESETFLPWNGGGNRTPYLAVIYDYLVYLDPVTREPEPGLATKWEMSADGKVWTLWLRQGVQFHGGMGEFTAEDAKYTMERTKGPDSIAGPSSTLRKLVDKVEAPERYKVVYYLSSPNSEFERGFLSDASQFPIVCKKYVESVGDAKANAQPIGTGPFTLAEYQKGSFIKFKTIEGVEKHWRVTPEFKEITFQLVPEQATRVAMLKAGEADLAPIDFDSFDTIKASGLKIISIPKNWVPLIRFGGLVTTDPKRYNPKAPWADKRVRQAMNYAIDKVSIAKNIFKGEAVPAASSLPFPEWMKMEPYPYDPGKAKQLLAEAGYPKGFPITIKTFTTVPGAQLPMIGEVVAMYWKAIGLDVKIVPTDWVSVRAEWTGKDYKSGDYVWTHRGFTFSTTGEGLPTEYSTPVLFATYATKETDAWLDRISKEFDAKKRNQLLKEFGLQMREEASAIFLVYANEPYGASKKVGRWPVAGTRPQNIELITHK